jgi:hypothetical protein
MYHCVVAMLLNRHRLLLGLLDALGGRVGNMDFQKLLFLYCRQASPSPYEFVPYRFGAFSFTSYADRRKLTERGLLANEEHHWVLTAAGRDLIANGLPLAAGQFVEATAHLRGDALVSHTYRQFPYYATNSEMAARILHNDPDALRRVDAARPVRKARLLTIGYEGLSLEGYLNKVLEAGVTTLCDVRRNPLSRKYGFAKRTLAQGCHGVGIRYEHLPELGIESSDRRGLETQASYDALFERYERERLPRQDAALSTITSWIRSGEAVALTCYEHLPAQCHRHCVAEAVERILPAHPAEHL